MMKSDKQVFELGNVTEVWVSSAGKVTLAIYGEDGLTETDITETAAGRVFLSGVFFNEVTVSLTALEAEAVIDELCHSSWSDERAQNEHISEAIGKIATQLGVQERSGVQ